jgi:hypothetical protein
MCVSSRLAHHVGRVRREASKRGHAARSRSLHWRETRVRWMRVHSVIVEEVTQSCPSKACIFLSSSKDTLVFHLCTPHTHTNTHTHTHTHTHTYIYIVRLMGAQPQSTQPTNQQRAHLQPPHSQPTSHMPTSISLPSNACMHVDPSFCFLVFPR